MRFALPALKSCFYHPAALRPGPPNFRSTRVLYKHGVGFFERAGTLAPANPRASISTPSR